MTPIFRRKPKPEAPAVANENPKVPDTPAPETASPESPDAAVSEDSALELEVSDDDAAVASEPSAPAEPVRSPGELIANAIETWHEELATAAAKAEASIAPNRGMVDLTHAHPTGAASFYSGNGTLLTSIIREDQAQRAAKRQLQELLGIVSELGDAHGRAPIQLAVGHASWTELPPAEEETAEFTDLYDATGELSLADVQSAIAKAEAEAQAPEAEQPEPEAVEGEFELAEESAVVDDEAAPEPEAKPEPEPEPEPEPREAIEASAPALFRNVRVEPRGGGDANLKLGDIVEVNPVVLRALRLHGATADQIADLRSSDQVANTLAKLRQLGRIYLPGFSYDEAEILGCFARPALSLMDDFESMESYMRTSGVLLALAGDAETRRLSAAPIPPGNPVDRAPGTERGAGDLDVAELDAIEAIASQRSLVIDAPPGSERIRTIASACADAAASGRSVIVIPSRGSVGQALNLELNKLGLGELVADFSDVDAIPLRIRTGLRLKPIELDEDAIRENSARLHEVRARLTNYVTDLHEVDDEWGMSINGLLDQLATLTMSPQAPRTRVRLGKEAVEALRGDGIETIRAKFAELGELGAFDKNVSQSAWAKSPVKDAGEAAEALDQARRLSEITVPAAIGQSSSAAGETGLRQANSLKQWFEQVDVLDGISDSLDVFLPEIFETSAMDMVIATAPKEWRDSHGHAMGRSDRHRYTKQARDLVRPGADPSDLHQALVQVQKRREIWSPYATEGGWPRLPDGMAQIRSTKDEVLADIKSLNGKLGGVDLLDVDFADLQEALRALVADSDSMSVIPQRNLVASELSDAGFQPLLDDVTARGVAPENTQAELDLAYTNSVFEQLIGKSKELGKLGAKDLSDLLDEFRALDSAYVNSLAGPVLRATVDTMRATGRSRSAEVLKLDELLAKHGVGALRDVIATYPRLVQVARPVWIVPPVVATELVPPMPWAEMVIMDAADDSSVASMVSLLLRGRQAVVVGDTRREASAIGDFAKVLPVVELPTQRAMHDALSVSALNSHGYDGVLKAVPSVKVRRAPRLVVVDGKGVPTTANGMVEGTAVEVEAVVDAVVNHVLDRPNKSLAVVTVSPVHAQRVREAIRSAAANSTALDALNRKDVAEPFDVVDISQTSGLRRDHIVLSVGLGKTVHGRVLHTFGQLGTPGGLAGLVDAIGAARDDLTVISCMGPGEIDTDRVSTPGPRLLAALISQAGGELVEVNDSAGEAAEPLLEDVAARIREAGWKTATNFGTDESIRIPLVAGHDDIPGTWAVAVLYDDAEYVAEKSLRRRNRFWVERLESRGWHVVQTFSSSLFINPAQQAGVITSILEELRGSAPGAAVTEVPAAASWEEDSWDAIMDEDLNDPHAVTASMAAIRERGPRPSVTPGLPLTAYTDDQLDELLAWIQSDGVPRSDEDLMAAIRDEIAMERRGGQIDAVLGNVIRRSKA